MINQKDSASKGVSEAALERCKHNRSSDEYCFDCVRERHNEDELDGRFDEDARVHQPEQHLERPLAIFDASGEPKPKAPSHSSVVIPESVSLDADCKYCAKGDMPIVLDRDGTLVSITGEPGVLSHAYEECWWPCLRFGVELRSDSLKQDALVDEVQRRMDTVVDAAVEKKPEEHHGVPSSESAIIPELDASRSETLEQRSERERNEALAKRDAAYISSDMDDFWGFGG